VKQLFCQKYVSYFLYGFSIVIRHVIRFQQIANNISVALSQGNYIKQEPDGFKISATP